jgi:cytochrome P450
MNDLRVGDESPYEDLFRIENAAKASGGAIDDPHPIWAELLAKGPVHKGTLAECMGLPPERSGGGLYMPGTTYYSVFSFAAVSEVFTRKDDFGSEVYLDMGTVTQFGDSILNMDGLRHRRYRDLIQPYFQPAMAQSWWRDKVIAKLVDELLESFEKQECVDLSAQYFSRLPLHTVTSGFGMSFQEGMAFRGEMLRTQHATTLQARAAAREGAGRVLESVIRARQQEPRDDLISKLAHAILEGEDSTPRNLSVEEIASFCRLIVFAGGETTWRQLGIAMFALLDAPEQLAEVIADRALLSNAILESTRWNPDPLFPRKVKRDTVLHGVKLPAGAHLHLCLAAANRDPKRWQNPEKYDIHRPVQRSVAFAAGAHSCLGQHVARQEIESALNGLFDRFPNIRWDPSKPPARLTGSLVQRGPSALPVLLH